MNLLSQLFNFSGLMRTGSELQAQNNISDDELDKAIEHVVDGVYPKIRYYPGYKKILKDSVLNTLNYIIDLVDSIPGPLLVSKQSFSEDPLIRSYFSTISIMQEVFSNSTELKSFFSEPVNCDLDEAYAMVCIDEAEKIVFGMELREDVVLRDVRQNILSFSDHKVLSPAASELEVRNAVKQCIFDGLITHALQKILEVEEKKQGLETQRCLLNSKLKERQSHGGGLSQLLVSASQNKNVETIEKQLLDNEKKLEELPECWDAPRYYLDMINETLKQPEQFIRMTIKSFNISKTGVVKTNNSSEISHTIHFNEILIANVLQRVVAVVRYPRNEMLDSQEFCLK